MPANTEKDLVLCFVCGEKPSVSYHEYFWDIGSSRAKAGFLCCRKCLKANIEKRILECPLEDLAAFQAFLDDCLEHSEGSANVIPLGRSSDGEVGWYVNLKVDHNETVH